MAHKQDSEGAGEVDEFGLQIQKYESMVLVVLPTEGFSEETLRYARSSLYNVHVGTYSVAASTDDPVRGELQDEFLVDGPLESADMRAYSGILVDGGRGAAALADDPNVQRLVREAHEQGKLIGTWGHGLAVLARAGVLRGKRVTGAPTLADEVRRAGGKYTGTQVETHGVLVTAVDDAAGMRFGKALADIVRI